MLKASVIILSLATSLAAQAVARGDRAPNQTYVQSGSNGLFYARCTPAGTDGTAGRMEVYRVADNGDNLLDRYDFYTTSVVLGWSPIKAQVAVMSVVREEGKDWKTQEEFRFLLGGKVLKSYTSGDLVALGAGEVESRPGGHRASYRVVGCEQVPGTSEYDFVIEIGQGKHLRFDILTGELRAA